ncbi:MAG: hypothetical protein ABI567_00545 [Gammaproteobacteria bacterium]
MRRISKLAAPLLLAGIATPAVASDFSLGATASTLGVGLEAGYLLNEHLGLRLGGYALTVNQDGEESGVNYKADLDLANVGLYLDWHPFAGALRLSAGWFATDNGLKATGTPGAGGTYDIGGSTFTAAEVGDLRGDVDLGSSAPFLGLGWVWGRDDGGLAFSLDFGVLFQGSPDVTLTSTGGTLSGQPALQDAIADEETQLRNDLDKYDLYPVASLGLSYRF